MKKRIVLLILAVMTIMAMTFAGCENPNVPKGDKVGSYAKA